MLRDAALVSVGLVYAALVGYAYLVGALPLRDPPDEVAGSGNSDGHEVPLS